MLLDLKNCSGQLGWHENSLNIDFDLSVAKDGSIKLIVKDIPFEKNVLWLHELYNKKKRYFEFLQLKGQDIEGNYITSSSVILNSLGLREDKEGSWMCPEATCMQLHLETNKPLTYSKDMEHSLNYYLLGFKCFGRLSCKTDFGSIKVAGSTKIKNYDEVTGVLRIKEHPGWNFDLTKWIDGCDKLVRSILDILSLANDRYIAWTSRAIFCNSSWVSSLFIGTRRSGEPSQPLFTYLNLQPILNLASTNYTEPPKQKTGLDVAIEWFLMKSTYAELEFLTMMTALEHLIYIYAEQNERSTIFKNEIFDTIISPQLKAALDHSLTILMKEGENAVMHKSYKKQVASAKRKISEMNRYPFKKNLRAFLKEHKVPLDGIDQGIDQLVDVRNKIVHRGLYISTAVDQSIHDHLAVLRELLIRIFLTLLKYSGEYQSFLNGPEWKKFLPLH